MATKKFLRKDTHKKSRLSKVWRKPKGIQNKRRLKLKGHAKIVKKGFGTNNAQKGMHKSGLEIITITQVEELKTINPKTQGVLFGKTGKKRKLELIQEAQKAKITIINLNLKKYTQAAERQAKSKKEAAIKRDKKQSEKQKAAKVSEDKKKAEEKKQEPDLSVEERQKQEKAEKDKILITKSNKA